MTLSQLVNLYLDDQEKTVKTSTYKRNLYACRTLLRILDPEMPLEDLTAGYIRKQLLDHDEKSGTRNERIARIRAMIRWAYRQDYISNTACVDKLDLFSAPSRRERVKEKFLQEDEAKALIKAIEQPLWKNLTAFLLLSGMRMGEAAALTWNDVDMENRVIHVTKTFDAVNDRVGTPKTETSIRDVFIQDDLLKLLESLPRRKGIVFRWRCKRKDSRGKYVHYYAYNKILKKVSLEVLGRPITAHTLRHTHASLLLQKGVPIDVISRRLGHSSITITQTIYLHITEKRKESDNLLLSEVNILS